MIYTNFITWLAKEASIGISYPKPRPAETPSQAKKAIPQKINFGTGVLQNIKPQQPVEVTQKPQIPEQTKQIPTQIGN